MLKWLQILFYSIFIFCAGCHSQASPPPIQTITVATQPDVSTIFLDSVIAPLQVYNIEAPIDGHVDQKYFSFGDEIKKDQPLLTIQSPQLADDYQSALTDYLKAKKDYLTDQSQMVGTQHLQKMGIIADQDYQIAVSTHYDLQMAYNQAATKLKTILSKLGQSTDLAKFNSDNKDVINKLISQPFNTLTLVAPKNGISLMPNKSTADNRDNNAMDSFLSIGSQIKMGDSLLTIGDMTGIAVTVKINELHINEIHKGLTALISSDAFPGIILHGQVVAVAQEASSDENNSTPTFSVKIVVPQLTAEQRKIIHVGMSAKIELQINSKQAIYIPITAVSNENGVTSVRLFDLKTRKIKVVEVQTGHTTLDRVEITRGLKDGDQVVVAG